MRNLLSADFARLWKNRMFFCCWVGMVLLALFLVAEEYFQPYAVLLNQVVFLPLSLYGVVAAAFAAMFLGQEYADGTIRNKLIAGHIRAHIYLSGFLVTAVGAVILYLSAIAVTASVGSFLFTATAPLKRFLLSGLLGVFSCLSYVGLYCLISVRCGNRSSSVVACMLLSVALLMVALYVNLQLEQDEYIPQLNITGVEQPDDVSVSISGEHAEALVTMAPNPHYLTGIKRQIAQLIQDLNPTGQAAQICAMSYPNPIQMALCSAAVVALTCLRGLSVFRRKDII